MAIDTSGYVTVAEAAKRLKLSTEQVRRRLRDGKLRGYRVGNQWFVEDAQQLTPRREFEPLIPLDVIAEVEQIKQQIAERNPGYVFDAVEMVKAVREDH